MPLVRVEVRNEYGLGLPELYKEANKDDPKAVLDGVAVAGLVGILRQLGDLAEFAAEVFHGLQEQVMITSSRSHKLMVRVQNVEAAFPPLEKAILAQRSHLHFAYTAGSHWHLRVRSEQNHFIYSDMPRFIMDSYEECREPPRLHLLDKFDSGGPGSCLKRYSDPTFFRKASAGSDETNVEKVSRDKKARRRKKKRAWLRNGEMSHDVPISNHSARTQFDSPNFGGQSSPSQTVSTSDVALKSDPGDQSNSFDSRTEPGYIDCVFRPSYARESEEREPKEFCSSRFKMHHNETFDSASLDEQSGVVDEDIQHSLSQEQTGPTSSSVTWDEKTEIMEPTGPQYDHDETTKMLATSFDLNNQEGRAFNSNTVDQIDFHFDDENMPTSVSCANQVDDVESETDNYVDALNTIESELEADLDCQTKREVEHLYALNNTLKDEMHDGLTAHHSDGHPPKFEKRVAAHVSSNGTMFGHNPNSVSLESHTAPYSSSNNGTSECYVYSQLPQADGKPAILDTSPGTELHGIADIAGGSNVETVVSNVSSSGSRELNSPTPMTNKIISSPFESQKSPSLPSGVLFWTNGGLLGLEPSKPPDFSVSNNFVSQGSVAKSKDDSILPSSQSDVLERDGRPVKPDVVVKSPKSIEHDPSSNCSTSCDNDQENGLSLKKIPQRFSAADLDVKLEQSSKENGNSSRMFEFSSRLLASGFRRQMSLDDDNHVSSVKSGVSEEKSQNRAYQTISRKAIKEPFGSGCPVTSPSSSPPLEHMKISFQPIDGFETSKLKLKLREESDCRESSGDMFPSFQLVPEPAISQHDDGSDSDDDTFCRSSPYMSDDYLSDHSDSNSELWESGESPRSKDHELYDALRRISTTESISSSLEIGVTAHGGIPDNSKLQSSFIEDGIEFSHSGRLLDLPGFDSLNPSYKEELGNDSNERLHFPKEPTPPPPPLPPLEWRGVKPHPDMATEKQDSLSEPLDYAFHSKLLAPIISQQPKPAPVKQDLYIEAAAVTPKSEQPDGQKLIKHKEANQAVNGKAVDEKEDFLHQIRAKSFNLRSTGIARPTFTPGAPTTNVKVTAILEKANAIRQAVGSDDGEDDDNWSDT